MPEDVGYPEEEMMAAEGLPPEGMSPAEGDFAEGGMPTEAEGEMPEEEIPEENLTEGEPETGATQGIPMSGEDVPELLNLEIGDTITLQVDDRAEDGTFTMSVVQDVAEAPAPSPGAGLGPEEREIVQGLI